MAFVNVEGEVSRINRTGNGFGLKETWETRDGRGGTRHWSVFPKDPAGVQVGDRVKVSGGLGTKVGDPKQDGKVYVDHTVNATKVERQEGAQQAAGQPNPSVADQWAGNTITGAQGAAEGGWGNVDSSPF